MCHSVAVEPTLLPLSGEAFTGLSTNTSENARADFWTRGEDSYFDVKVFHPPGQMRHRTSPNRQPASLNSMSGISDWNMRNGLSTSTVGPSLRWYSPQQAHIGARMTIAGCGWKLLFARLRVSLPSHDNRTCERKWRFMAVRVNSIA